MLKSFTSFSEFHIFGAALLNAVNVTKTTQKQLASNKKLLPMMGKGTCTYVHPLWLCPCVCGTGVVLSRGDEMKSKKKTSGRENKVKVYFFLSHSAHSVALISVQ